MGDAGIEPSEASVPVGAPVQAKSEAGSSVPQRAAAAPSGSGEQLPDDVQAKMSESFASDFSAVRVHQGPQADALGARAYTQGSDIHFAAGKYQPDSQSGQELLGHELTHVVQQRQGRVRAPAQAKGLAINDDAALEAEADAMGAKAARGERAVPTPAGSAAQQQDAASGSALAQAKSDGPVQMDGGEDAQRRVDIAQILLALNPGMTATVAMLNLLGFQVTGAAIGVRESGTAAAGLSGGVGSDQMAFFDFATGRLSGDVVGYGEVGLGLQVGGSVGIVVALRISPRGNVGRPNESYAGTAINAELHAIAGVGFSISPGLFQGQEGWVGMCVSGGEEAGGSVSISYGVSGSSLLQMMAGGLSGAIGGLAQGIAGAVEGAAALGSAVGAAVEGMAQAIVAVLDPANWNLTGYDEAQAAAFREFGGVMKANIERHGLDTFLAQESSGTGPNVSARVQEMGGSTMTLISVYEAMRYMHREMTTPDAEDIWSPTDFTARTYLEWLTVATDNQLI